MRPSTHSEQRLAHNRIARVLLVDDEPDILELLELALLRMGLDTDRASSIHEAREKLDTRSYDLCLTDMRLPDGEGTRVLQHIAEQRLDLPVAVITAHGNMESAISALKAGAFDYLNKPVSLQQLRALVQSAIRLHEPKPADGHPHDLLGSSPAIQHARELIARVARTQSPVHICGESGSGKELAARLLVAQGSRADRPFIAVNCGAIPENLMESEFFGYCKGAFTGAEQARDGFFQAADGGTLFLDEIADLPLSMQVKLLRAIQEKKVRKVGDTEERPVDVRIISATHRNLAGEVKAGRFRQDLYYRLNVITLAMPPLREMREDIPQIAAAILQALSQGQARFAPAALKVLQNYDFPGNVRELENLVERALALSTGPEIGAADLLPDLGTPDAAGPGGKAGESLPEYLDQVERAAILRALGETGFNRTAAARLLGVTFRALRHRMARLDIRGKTADEHED